MESGNTPAFPLTINLIVDNINIVRHPILSGNKNTSTIFIVPLGFPSVLSEAFVIVKKPFDKSNIS